MSPIPSLALAARVTNHLRVTALLALLLTQIPPALASDAGLARSAPAAPSAAAGPARPTLAAARVTATQADMLLVDLNGNRWPDPGDTLRYTVVIDNGSGADLSGLAFEEMLDISNPFGTSDAVATIAVQQIPAITSADAVTFTVGITGSFSVTTVGVPPPVITLTGALPNGMAFVDNTNGTAKLVGQPGVGTEGSYPLTFGASNLFGSSAPQTFTLNVQAAIPKLYGGSPSAAAPLSASLGLLPAGKHVTITFDTLIADPLPVGVGQVVNQGAVSGSGFASLLTDDPDRPGAADPTITFVGTRKMYLPVLMYKYPAGPPLPDLVVENITSAGDSVSVTLRNDGLAPVVAGFWIDLYIGPGSAPVHVNQLWSDVGSRGVTWG